MKCFYKWIKYYIIAFTNSGILSCKHIERRAVKAVYKGLFWAGIGFLVASLVLFVCYHFTHIPHTSFLWVIALGVSCFSLSTASMFRRRYEMNAIIKEFEETIKELGELCRECKDISDEIERVASKLS